jgi:DNA-binding protein HU-beta
MIDRKSLAAKLAESTELGLGKSREVVKGMIDIIIKSVAEGEIVKLAGFGQFYSTVIKAHTGRNPITGESIEVPTKKTPRFSPGKTFKKAVV